MRHFLSSLPYPDKDVEVVGAPDPQIVGHAHAVIGADDSILGKTSHPESRKA